MSKALLSNTLRNLGLLYPLDKWRFRIAKHRIKQANQKFKSANPVVKLPPDYLIYESFQLDYHKYYFGGKETAKWVVDLISKYIKLDGALILDWGCGPARVIRHLPDLLPKSAICYGADYNEASIKWCKANVENVNFNHNQLEAKLPYEDQFFDAIYGISIFTHLSEEMHYKWFAELNRILKTDGIMLLTTQGENFKSKLTASEVKRFDSGELIVRGKVKEGHRTFSAFHPDEFLKTLFGKDMHVLEKIIRTQESKSYTPQDTWLLRKVR